MLKRRLFGMFTPLPMMDADGSGGGEGSATGSAAGVRGAGATEPQKGEVNGDFEKLLNIVEGRMRTSEESVLKGFYKEQGLSQEEAQQAIAAFKAEKAKNQPNPDALKRDADSAKETAKSAIAESRAILLAVGMGIEVKSIPYVLKLADMSNAVKDDGALDGEAIKAAINKVLEDVPALKGSSAPVIPMKPEYSPKGGAASTVSRAAEIAAARKKATQTDNPYANAWAQK